MSRLLNLDVDGRLKLTAEEVVGVRMAILGIPGSGKSNTAAVFAEEVLRYMPGTIIDIDGDYHGLQAMYPQIIIAGASRQATLPLTDAVSLAQHSWNDDVPVILDFNNTREKVMYEYLLDYLTTLWELSSPEEARKPYLLLVEEAHKFIPQSAGTPVKDVLRDLSGRGRKRGVLTVLVSQNSQKVDKDALTNSAFYFLHTVTHYRDVGTYQALIPRPPRQVAEMIGALSVGSAIYRQGKIVQVVSIRPRITVHSGKTPTLKPPNWDNADVITLYECEGERNYLCSVGGSPDSKLSTHYQQEHLTPRGTPVVICANFPDLLRGDIIADVLAGYDECRLRKLKDEWFTLQAGRLWDFWSARPYPALPAASLETIYERSLT